MEGWIKIHRQIVENPLYFSEPFTRTQAWIDLIIIANHKEGFFYKRGIRVIVKRSQIGYDVYSLAKRWRWSRGKVERFLIELEKDNQIVRQKNNITTLISIVNYEYYQTDGKANKTPNSKANSKADGHQTVKQTDTNNNNKEEKELKNDNNDNSLYKNFVAAYFNFHTEILKNPKPKFGSREGKSINELIKYFKAATENDEIKALDAFKIMFANWKELSAFHQAWVDINTISNNITTIINDLRNGKSTNSKADQRLNAFNNW